MKTNVDGLVCWGNCMIDLVKLEEYIKRKLSPFLGKKYNTDLQEQIKIAFVDDLDGLYKAGVIYE